MEDNGHFLRVHRLHRDAILPEQAHTGDAGLDIFTYRAVTIQPHEDAVIYTGLQIAVPGGHAGIVKEKSGIAVKQKLVVGACVVDSGYRGELLIHLINTSRRVIVLPEKSKIAQLLVVPVRMPIVMEANEPIPENTSRGSGNMGSSGLFSKGDDECAV